MDDHGSFALGGLLPDSVHELQDALGSVCWRHAVVGPGRVVKVHHILGLVSLWGGDAEEHVLVTSSTLSVARANAEDQAGATVFSY